ncbi:hypothetical protein D5086_006628 [Populus alba]|uniref:Uncharacterized protein n=1 Tax=Populus alba TaxID=43335 RepID=A0ACC4CMB7_POPAL
MVDGTTCRKTSEIHAVVPYRGRGRAKHEVDLDPESLRKWNQLVKIYSGVDEEKEDGEREQWWRRELLTFQGRIDLFISLLHHVLGSRCWITFRNTSGPDYARLTIEHFTFLDGIRTTESGPNGHTCKPIVEEPKSPLHEQDIEDFRGMNLYVTSFSFCGHTPLPAPKMKCVISWRTEHQVYELPDNHELLVGLDKREKDDSVPFLLSICQAGETPYSSQPPVKLCNSQGSQLSDQRTCFACEGI